MNQSVETGPVNDAVAAKLWWRLLIETYLTFVLAVFVGSLIGAGFGVWFEVRSYWESTYLIADSPADDDAIEKWALSQPGVVKFQTERREGELWVRSEYVGFSSRPASVDLTNQLRALGYDIRGLRGGAMGALTSVSDIFSSPVFLATAFGSLQLVLAVAGWRGMRKARKRSPNNQPVSVGRVKAVRTGLLCGVLLLAVGVVHDLILRAFLGDSPPSLWDEIDGLPIASLVVLIGFGAIGAPVTEEIFFRGYVFGRFQSSGLPWLGVVVSSVLFGAAHFADPWHIPGIILFGVILAWTYQRTGTLLAPITAHAVNNVTGLLLLASSS